MMALPILTGSLVRMPLGLWADRGDGRRLILGTLALAIPALVRWYATAYWHFLLMRRRDPAWSAGCLPWNALRRALVRPQPARYGDGGFRCGHVGAALDRSSCAPVLLVGFGWVLVPQMYGALML